jgi:hypothetical protein
LHSETWSNVAIAIWKNVYSIAAARRHFFTQPKPREFITFLGAWQPIQSFAGPGAFFGASVSAGGYLAARAADATNSRNRITVPNGG